MTWIRTLMVCGAVLLATAVPARADVYIAAVFGSSMGGVLDSSKTTYGGQFGILGPGMIGVEGDYGFTMKVKGGHGGDNFRTLSGSVLFAPLKIGTEKVRPYASIGGGMISAVTEMKQIFIGGADVETKTVITAGGGVFAYLSRQIGVRFDARYMKLMLESDPDFDQSSYFIRVTGGVVVRF